MSLRKDIQRSPYGILHWKCVRMSCDDAHHGKFDLISMSKSSHSRPKSSSLTQHLIDLILEPKGLTRDLIWIHPNTSRRSIARSCRGGFESKPLEQPLPLWEFSMTTHVPHLPCRITQFSTMKTCKFEFVLVSDAPLGRKLRAVPPLRAESLELFHHEIPVHVSSQLDYHWVDDTPITSFLCKSALERMPKLETTNCISWDDPSIISRFQEALLQCLASQLIEWLSTLYTWSLPQQVPNKLSDIDLGKLAMSTGSLPWRKQNTTPKWEPSSSNSGKCTCKVPKFLQGNRAQQLCLKLIWRTCDLALSSSLLPLQSSQLLEWSDLEVCYSFSSVSIAHRCLFIFDQRATYQQRHHNLRSSRTPNMQSTATASPQTWWPPDGFS